MRRRPRLASSTITSTTLAAALGLTAAALCLAPASDSAAAVGKQAGVGKRAGAQAVRVSATPTRPPLGVAVAIAAKAEPPAPHVQAALVRMSAASSIAPKIRLDPVRGTLHRFEGRVDNPHGAGPIAAARLLASHQDALGLAAAPGAVDLVPTRVIHDPGEPGDGTHLVYAVHYRGLPVWTAELAAHFDGAGALTSVNAQALGRLAPAMELRYGPEAARQRARLVNQSRSDGGHLVDHGAPELGVWPATQQKPGGALTWRLVQEIREADGTPQRIATFVDAESGAVVARHPLLITAKAQATTTTATDLFNKQVTLRISHYPDTNTYALIDQSKGAAGARLNTRDAAFSAQSYGAVVTDKSKTGWTKSEATAHNHMQRVIDYFQATHARNSWDGQGADVDVSIHFGQHYNNAFWDPSKRTMVIGDGDGKFFTEFTRALDVAAHEFSHAVVSGTVNLIYQGQSGALNESFADVMACMVDRDDWTIAEDILGPSFPYPVARSLADPPLGNQPGHMKDLWKTVEDYGGVHTNSGIPNHAAYQLASKRSREVVEQIWYRTLYKNHVNSGASFIDMAEGTMTACNELVALGKASAADCQANAEAWVVVGVLAADQVPMNGCPDNATEKDGLCYCDDGTFPSNDGTACVAYGDLQCPANSIPGNGTCYCQDGFVPNADFSQCVAKEMGCPLNAEWNGALKQCVCKAGFEGIPSAPDGKCDAIDSDCPENAHPEWPDPNQPDVYNCLCNDNFEFDGNACQVIPGSCGNESFHGRCEGDALVYCKQSGDPDDGIQSVDCGADGLTCGLFDSLVGMDCLNPNGVPPAGSCDADGYQECDDSAPFCVAEAGEMEGFCSHECKATKDCEPAFDCCATVSDGTRACLVDPYCADNIDPKATCDDVPGGSTYYGKCEGGVLVYCDGSTKTTQEVFCAALGLECGWVDAATGYNCVPPDSGALPNAPDDYCPYDHDGVCDVPANCPEGSDLFDCNPCGAVPAAGVCEGDVLKVCDPDVGLVTTDCADLEATPTCGGDGAGGSACVPGDGGGTGGETTGGGDDTASGGGDDATATAGGDGGGQTITCTCSSEAAPGPWSLGLGVLALLGLRRRRRA